MEEKKIHSQQLFSASLISDACKNENRNFARKRIKTDEAFPSNSPVENYILKPEDWGFNPPDSLKEQFLKLLEGTPHHQIVKDSFCLSLALDKSWNLWCQCAVDFPIKKPNSSEPLSFLLRIDLSSKANQKQIFYPFYLSDKPFKQLLLSWPWPTEGDLAIDPPADKNSANFTIKVSLFRYPLGS